MRRFGGLMSAGALAPVRGGLCGLVEDDAAAGGFTNRAASRRGPGTAPAQQPAAPPAGQPAAAGAQPTEPAAGQPGAPAGGRGRGTPPPPPPTPPSVMPKPAEPIISGTAPSPDPRVGLKPGWWDAAQAAWNMNMVSTTPPSGKSLGATHSDLAFSGRYAIQGQYNGFDIYDISNPEKPLLVQQYLCPASQNDVSVYKNLLFMSSEATNSRTDCGFGGVPDPVSKDRVRGIRVFDISDMKNPKLVTSVQTCRGSHTHTVVTQPGDNDNVYIYVSGTSGVRSADELPGCSGRRHRRSEHGALPSRSDQGAPQRAGAGGNSQLAAHVQRSARRAAQSRA